MSDRLAERCLALVDIPSESRHETEVLDRIRAEVPAGLHELVDDEDAVLLYLPLERRKATLVVFAGHVDTVPIAKNVPGRRVDGTIQGRGAADMKAGLAVMLELMDQLAGGRVRTDLDVGFLFFGREEISTDESALLPLFGRRPELGETALAIVLEPTGNAIEVGCLGNLVARVHVEGAAAHSARPWLGDNAIHRAIAALGPIAELPIRDVEIDGLVYREVSSITRIRGGTADNVVPDRATATINVRYAPTHTPAEAEARLRELLATSATDIEIVSNARPGPVVVQNPLVDRLRASAALEVRAKQAWTPVAEFAEGGIDAVNFGPGDPRYAHTDDERVEVADLERCVGVLSAFLSNERG
jgi:succinyl-diaminopimelate desuccinylase